MCTNDFLFSSFVKTAFQSAGWRMLNPSTTDLSSYPLQSRSAGFGEWSRWTLLSVLKIVLPTAGVRKNRCGNMSIVGSTSFTWKDELRPCNRSHLLLPLYMMSK